MAESNNQHAGGGFEHTDIHVVAVGKVGVLLLLTTLMAMVLIVGVFKVLQSMEGGKAVTVDPAKVFPQPQLQTKPVPDLSKFEKAEDERLNSYGWTDEQKTTVHIPINQAIDMLVQKGLPVRTATPPGAEEVSQPTESGLGPKVQQPGGPLGEGK
jgi:hypothetical protein